MCTETIPMCASGSHAIARSQVGHNVHAVNHQGTLWNWYYYKLTHVSLKRTSQSSLISKKMPISKFKLFEQRNDDDLYRRWNGIMRNYMYENALCRVATDARLCKIQRIAVLVNDDDVVNNDSCNRACKFSKINRTKSRASYVSIYHFKVQTFC